MRCKSADDDNINAKHSQILLVPYICNDIAQAGLAKIPPFAIGTAMSAGAASYTCQTITHVHFWVPGKLFSIRTTRDAGFHFTAGQFARLGLAGQAGADAAGSPSVPGQSLIWRAYSMVNAPAQDGLEFYSIVVPNGQFSPLLAQVKVGDTLYVDNTAFGFLTLDRFADGGVLWLLATGTGLSAFLSILQDEHTWQRFERVILVHGVRTCEELAYAQLLQGWVQQRAGQFCWLPIPTRQAAPNVPGLPALPRARITRLIEDGQLAQLAGCPLEPAHSKVMLCGNPNMIRDARVLLQARGFAAGRRGNPGTLAVETYW